LANLLTFPIVIILMVTSYLIVNVLPTGGAIWTPPLLTELNPQAFTVMLGMGIFFMTPELVKIVQELLGFKDLPGAFSIGTFFGGVGAAWGGATSGLGMFTSLMQMPFIGGRITKSPLYKDLVSKGVLPPTMGEMMADRLADLKKKGEF